MDEFVKETIWLSQGFSETEAETISLFYKKRYGMGHSDLEDKRILCASQRHHYTLDSDVLKAGFSSRLDMAKAILEGTRDDLLY